MGLETDNYRLLCAAQVNWYQRFGRYPARLRYDGHGVQYVIGDWSWNRVYRDFPEHIETAPGFPADLPGPCKNAERPKPLDSDLSRPTTEAVGGATPLQSGDSVTEIALKR